MFRVSRCSEFPRILALKLTQQVKSLIWNCPVISLNKCLRERLREHVKMNCLSYIYMAINLDVLTFLGCLLLC